MQSQSHHSNPDASTCIYCGKNIFDTKCDIVCTWDYFKTLGGIGKNNAPRACKYGIKCHKLHMGDIDGFLGFGVTVKTTEYMLSDVKSTSEYRGVITKDFHKKGYFHVVFDLKDGGFIPLSRSFTCISPSTDIYLVPVKKIHQVFKLTVEPQQPIGPVYPVLETKPWTTKKYEFEKIACGNCGRMSSSYKDILTETKTESKFSQDNSNNLATCFCSQSKIW
jgi:hypothetical protein